MADKCWTTSLVEDRLVEAADVLSRLPEERVQGYFSVWPEVVRDFADMVGRTPEPMRRPPPSPAWKRPSSGSASSTSTTAN